MMGFGLIFTLLLIVAVVYALGWRPQTQFQPDIGTDETPLGILKARYARGEISKTEFETMRDQLRV